MAYPYWDADNRYIVTGPTGKATVFAQAYLHPSGFWQARCYGNQPVCPQHLGPYFNQTAVQIAMEQHCHDVHYVLMPPLGPAPTLSNVSPASAFVGGPATTLTLTGTNFLDGATVYWLQSLPLQTTFLSATQLTATLPAGQLTTPGSFSLYVINPDQQQTSSLPFTVTPYLTSISPATGSHSGSNFTLTVNGIGFDSAPVIYFNATLESTTIVTAGSKLSASISNSQIPTAGSYPVYVRNSNSTQSNTINFIAT